MTVPSSAISICNHHSHASVSVRVCLDVADVLTSDHVLLLGCDCSGHVLYARPHIEPAT